MIRMPINRSKVRIVLNKSTIDFEFYSQTDTLKIPPTLFNHLKVVDSKGLERLIIEFIAKNYPKKVFKAIIVPSSEININQSIVDLNLKDYLEVVEKAIQKFDWLERPKLSLRLNRRLTKSQFFTSLTVSIVAIAMVFVWQAFGNFFQPHHFDFKSGERTPSPVVNSSVAQTASPSATPFNLDLSVYQVRILNGSGITNQASKLKTQLAKAGFSDITTTNASNNQINTTIVYSPSVSKPVRDFVKSQLSQDYNKIVVLDDDLTSKYDITITIGGG